MKMKRIFVFTAMALAIAVSTTCLGETVEPAVEEESEYYPQTVELASKIMIDIPQGFEPDEENSGFRQLCMHTDNGMINSMRISGSTRNKISKKIKNGSKMEISWLTLGASSGMIAIS